MQRQRPRTPAPHRVRWAGRVQPTIFLAGASNIGVVVLEAMGADRPHSRDSVHKGLLFYVHCRVGCRGELCSPATLHFLLTVHMCGVRAIADRPYRRAEKQLGAKATFHLISRLKATASPQGEAMARGHAKAFPLRGRWPKAG